MAKKATEYPQRVKCGNVTVTIYRTKNRDGYSYVVAHLEPGELGKLRRKLRQFSDPGAASKAANDTAELLAHGEREVSKMSDPDRASFVAAEEAVRPTGVSLVTAANHFAEAFRILGHDGVVEAARFFKARAETLPDLTVAEAVAKYVAAKAEEGISAKYSKDLRLMLVNGLATAFRCRLTGVTPDDLRGYLAGMKCGPVAKNNHRRVIVAFFNHAKKARWLAQNENTAAETLSAYNVIEKDVTIYTPAEVANLLSNADRDFLPWLALIAFGGLRHEELSKGFAWESVNLEKGILIVPAEIAKTGRKRKVELAPNLQEWLAPYRGSTGAIYPQDPDFRIAKTSKAAGVAWKRNALRHSFGSYRMESTKNAGQVSLEMGNSPKVVLDHYHEIVDAADAATYWNIRPGGV